MSYNVQDEDALVLFHQSLMVWMHPFFPFFDLFPRMGPQASNTQQTPLVLNESQLSLMKEHWCIVIIIIIVVLYAMVYFTLGRLPSTLYLNSCTMGISLISISVPMA